MLLPIMFRFLPILLFASFTLNAAEIPWVQVDPSGKLVYKSTERGDRIMDFSFAGYMGGGVALPAPAVAKTVNPSGGEDDSAAIQAAIDNVSSMPLVAGFRGAVLLSPGVFTCKATLTIKSAGVVLRGSGSGVDGRGTTLRLAGGPHVCINISGPRAAEPPGPSTPLTDTYVPCGANSFEVADATAFHAGDTILIRRPVTPAWVHFMDMDTLVRDGKKETWIAGETHMQRRIVSIAGRRITVDMPLADSLDPKYLNPPGASIARIQPATRISQVGVESLHIVAPAQSVSIDQPLYKAIQMDGVADGFLRDISIADTTNSVSVGGNSARITVDNLRITHTVATQGAAKPADLSSNSPQTLFNRCTSTGDNLFYFVTGARVTGPIVLLNCTFKGSGHLQPHQRWATGLLVDNCHCPGGGIDFMNRGEMGSGHGWTIGWAVAWNCSAKSFIIQNPPGSVNWAIGCKGTFETSARPFAKEPKLPAGIIESANTPVAPESLYPSGHPHPLNKTKHPGAEVFHAGAI